MTIDSLAFTPAGWTDPVLVLTIVTSLAMLTTSRLVTCVRLVVLQGVLVSLMPLALQWGHLAWRTAAFCLLALVVKGLVFPLLLKRTLRRAKVTLEIEPYIGFQTSLILGIAGLLLAMGLESRLHMPATMSSMAFSVAFATILSGFILIITRRKAVTQVIGYLAAENGIFLLGAFMAPHTSVIVELCILLDLLVAVFVMGIAIHHISREFHSVDTNLISTIRD
jgi:hydrogenase-4 component E